MALILRGGNESVENIILAVSIDGNDNDANRPKRIVGGDWSGNPFSTIQAALDALPPNIGKYHAVVINVGAGTFPGFTLNGKILGGFTTPFPGTFAIVGTRQTAVPATGPASGTADGGGGRTLVLTGAGWTPDDLVGKFVNVTSGPGSGQILPIAKNTSDTLTLSNVASPAFGAGSVFTIQDIATVLNSAPPSSTYCVGFRYYMGRVNLSDIKALCNGFSGFQAGTVAQVSYVRCVAEFVASAASGFVSSSSNSVSYTNCVALGAFLNSGIIAQWDTGLLCSGVLLYNNIYGLALNKGNPALICFAAYFRGCTWGLWVQDSNASCYDAIFDSCGTAIFFQRSLSELQRAQIDNATTAVTSLELTSLTLSGSLTGTGNAGFGLDARGGGNTVILSGFTPTIAGASGDATVDGTTALVWATDLAVSGDYARDLSNGAHIYRR